MGLCKHCVKYGTEKCDLTNENPPPIIFEVIQLCADYERKHETDTYYPNNNDGSLSDEEIYKLEGEE